MWWMGTPVRSPRWVSRSRGRRRIVPPTGMLPIDQRHAYARGPQRGRARAGRHPALRLAFLSLSAPSLGGCAYDLRDAAAGSEALARGIRPVASPAAATSTLDLVRAIVGDSSTPASLLHSRERESPLRPGSSASWWTTWCKARPRYLRSRRRWVARVCCTWRPVTRFGAVPSLCSRTIGQLPRERALRKAVALLWRKPN